MERQKQQSKSKSKTQKHNQKPQTTNSSNDMMMIQRAIDDPTTLDAKTIGLLNKTHGNHFVNRLIQRSPNNNTIQRSPGDDKPVPGTQLWSVETFKNRAPSYYSVWWGMTDQTIYDIIEKLEIYHADTSSGMQLVMVKQMMDLVEKWLRDHRGESDEKDYKVIKRFGTLLDTRYSELRKPVEKDYFTSSLGDDWVEPDEMNNRYSHIKKEHEGSPSSMFTKVAGLLDQVVPAVGKSKVDVEFTWPVLGFTVGLAEALIKLGGHISIEGERSPDGDMKVVAEFTGLGVAEAKVEYVWESTFKAELGGFFEVQADNSEEAMKLLSYGFYRRMTSTSSDTLTEIAHYLWSGGMWDSSLAQEFSEEWAADVEGEAFGDGDDDSVDGQGGNNYVMTGVVAGLSLEGKSKAANVGGKGAYKGKWGTRYDSENKDGIGQRIHELSAEGTFGDNATGKLAYQWLYNDDNDNMQGDKLTFEGAAVIGLDKLNDTNQWLTGSFLIPTFTSLIERAQDLANSEAAAGGIAGMMMDATTKNMLIGATAGAEFPNLLPNGPMFGEKGYLDGSLKTKLSIELENLFTPGKPLVASVALASEGDISTGENISKILKVTLEQSKLLLKFTYNSKTGSLTVDYPD